MTEARAGKSARILGVDGGGTSTVAWLAEPGGNVLGRGKAGPSNAKAVGVDSAQLALDAAIHAAFADASEEQKPAEVACFGVAGFDRPDDRRLLADWSDARGWARRLVLVNDGDLVVAAGTPEGWGAGVIAGTGSISVGRDRNGRTARAGGWGHLIGDEGSAYAVSLAALRLVVRRFDGREPSSAPPDVLTESLCRALGVEGPSRIVTALYAPDFDRARIAALAPAVLSASRSDPEVARQILGPGGRALGEQVLAVARALRWEPGPLPFAVAGGFLLSAPPVLESLLNTVTAAGFAPAVVPVPEPVLGAVVLADRAYRGDDSA